MTMESFVFIDSKSQGRCITAQLNKIKFDQLEARGKCFVSCKRYSV